MIEIEIDESSGLGSLTMRRNRSLSWEGNKKFIALMAVLALVISTGFSLMGAWLIFPFAGLEVGVLTLCIYLTALRQQDREILVFTADNIEHFKGRQHPELQGRYVRDAVYFEIEDAEAILSPSRLWLVASADGVVTKQSVTTVIAGDREKVEIGIDLSDEEKEALVVQLQNVQLSWRNRHIRWA